jgi:hypothetical protein
MKKYFSDPKEREKLSVSTTKRYDDNPSLRKKASIFSLKRFSDPKEREKISITTKKALENLIVRKKISVAGIERYSNVDERKKDSETTKKTFLNTDFRNKHRNAIKMAMHKPDIRKKHINALLETKYIGRKTDKGQLELLEKWNRIGFKFEPNYPVYTNSDLFYIDGYDKEHNVVLEYDSKYHSRLGQQEKDLIRQTRIIDILNPKKFWRYDAIKHECRNVMIG